VGLDRNATIQGHVYRHNPNFSENKIQIFSFNRQLYARKLDSPEEPITIIDQFTLEEVSSVPVAKTGEKSFGWTMNESWSFINTPIFDDGEFIYGISRGDAFSKSTQSLCW